MAPFLVVEDIRKQFDHGGKSLQILKGISFSVEQGEMMAVVGASGAGKSTLLHILGGLDRPSSGRILFEGQDISTLDSTRLARFRSEKVGFVFQFHHLMQGVTAEENVMIPCLIRGMAPAKARQLARVALERVGLAHRLTHRPGELSGGEQQRVALARAVVMEPPLILADEPTGNLDSASSREIHDLFFELNDRLKATMLIVTHSRELATLLPRRLEIRDGVIVQ